MSAHQTVAIVGRDAPLWLAAAVLRRALGVEVVAVELPPQHGAAHLLPTLPPLEALHHHVGIDEAALLRTTRGAFTLGQNFADTQGLVPSFLHAHGGYGAAIDGGDFFPHWLKARRLGLRVGLDDFSLTATAARQGRLMLPDEESERFTRADYGYHLPAAAYARALKAIALHSGVTVHEAQAFEVERGEGGTIAAIRIDTGARIAADLFVDASGAEAVLIGGMLDVPQTRWRASFPVDRILSARGPRFQALPVYAEIRAQPGGWSGMYPTQTHTHLIHAYSSACTSDAQALQDAAAIGLPLSEVSVADSDPGIRDRAWEANCVAIGDAACVFDPVHGVGLHAVQLGLIHLLACFPAGSGHAAQRAEYNRVTASLFGRIRDFQSAYYALNRYGDSPFWNTARGAQVSPDFAHAVALFRVRGEIAPFEDESFAPDSWRAIFTGQGVEPEGWPPGIDRSAPETVKAQFRRMLGYVREQVLRQPTHDEYLARIARRDHG